ncbi:PP2C family protein-serine/threonine phosphatase [Thiocystis violacea]|uniref:PP2C family protein-serine/threonine phosphatase n=1 Tax=Thiocystis violacea TaxID=13725 RepID=UPI0019047B37|nr:PP2C family serine/threonine-protein phosphatase [Thiocystis violacea]MBK1720488.1 hypothetical protein [Thiocystis violacea]
MSLSLHPGNAQWIGQRAEQQDAFGFVGCEARGGRQTGDVLVVLADGMGGLRQGGEASRLAVRTFLAQAAASANAPVATTLANALHAANQAVNALARATEGEGEVGTTLIAAAVREGRLDWIGVGDSRLYLYRAADRSLTPCNDSHNLEHRLWPRVIAGHLTPEDIAADPDRDALTSFLGLPEIPETDASVRPLPLEPGDRLLLCSDGVDGVLSRDELKALLPGDPQSAAETLIARLRERALEYQDNATVAILACEPMPGETTVPTRRRWPRRLARLMLVGALLTGTWLWFDPQGWLDADSTPTEATARASRPEARPPTVPADPRLVAPPAAVAPEATAE